MTDRELDAEIAGRIFGWKLCYEGQRWSTPEMLPMQQTLAYDSLPHYSASMADAWLVVEKMRVRKYTIEIKQVGGNYRTEFLDNGMRVGSGEHASIERSICRAALQTIDK